MRCMQPKTFSSYPLEWIAHTRGLFSSLLVYEISMAGAVDEGVLTLPRSNSKKRIGFFTLLKTKLSPSRIGAFFFFPVLVGAFSGASSSSSLGGVLSKVFCFLDLGGALSEIT